MQTRQLGASDLFITPIGFGSWAIAGQHSAAFSWGPQDDQDSIAAIQRALDLGVNWIDTAAAYGRGHSEEIVGRALTGRASRLRLALRRILGDINLTKADSLCNGITDGSFTVQNHVEVSPIDAVTLCNDGC